MSQPSDSSKTPHSQDTSRENPSIRDDTAKPNDSISPADPVTPPVSGRASVQTDSVDLKEGNTYGLSEIIDAEFMGEKQALRLSNQVGVEINGYYVTFEVTSVECVDITPVDEITEL